MAKSRVIRQIRHGQITIPKEIRDDLELQPHDLLQISSDGLAIKIIVVKAEPKDTNSSWARELYGLFDPVRKDLGDRYSEHEINDAIDHAIRGARADANQ